MDTNNDIVGCDRAQRMWYYWLSKMPFCNNWTIGYGSEYQDKLDLLRSF